VRLPVANIPEEAVEAAAEAVYGSGFDGSPQRDAWLADFRKALEAAAPHLLEQAWNEGHEAGFWNGRESAGSGEMEACGVEHAKLHNPYTAMEG
jgi:hypothetical protein